MLKKIITIILSSLILCSCGLTGTNGNYDHSTDWNKNYYGEWDSGMKEISRHNIPLTESEVFTLYSDENFYKAFPDSDKFSIYTEDEGKSFGMHYKLSSTNETFRDGYLSKLYDGRIMCFGRYEKVRVQVGESGFGTMLPIKANEGEYFAFHFKSALDFKTKDSNPSVHESIYDIKVTLYKEDGANTYNYVFDDYFTNAELYHMFGFKVPGGLKGVYGYSIEYKLISDQFNETTGKNLAHALFIYEVFMPGSTWLNR